MRIAIVRNEIWQGKNQLLQVISLFNIDTFLTYRPEKKGLFLGAYPHQFSSSVAVFISIKKEIDWNSAKENTSAKPSGAEEDLDEIKNL